MNRVVLKREYTSKWKLECGPNIVAKIEKERNKGQKWQVEWYGDACHEVFWDDLVYHLRERYAIRLANHSCSCGK